MSLVEAGNWDISLGIAEMSLGRYILSATSDSPEDAPEAIDHVGLKVFGNLYEYGDLGILTTPVQEGEAEEDCLKSKYPAFSLRNIEALGFTNKSQQEFEDWVQEMNETTFQGSNYDVVNCSCVSWGREAANFLQVPYPPNWDKIINWAEKNKSVTSVFGAAGLGARHVQHSLEDESLKLKEGVKRLYRKLKPKKNEDDPDSEDDDQDDNDN